MSREVLFRAWSKKRNALEEVDVVNGKAVRKGYQWFLTDNDMYDSELEQYTGLTDKNGMKIFDGDQFLIDGKMYFVQCIKDRGGYVLTNGKGFDSYNCIDFNCDSIFGLEVIGNIHEVENER